MKAVESDITRLFGRNAPRRVGRKGQPPKAAYTPQKRGRKGNRGQKPGALKKRILEV